MDTPHVHATQEEIVKFVAQSSGREKHYSLADWIVMRDNLNHCARCYKLLEKELYKPRKKIDMIKPGVPSKERLDRITDEHD